VAALDIKEVNFMSELWGRDIRLLKNLERQNDRDKGSDLSIVQRPEIGRGLDLDVLSDLDNLRQALLLRFLTPMGELTALGHPSYGSRLFELIGELNSETNRNRAKVFVLQALAEEPRVKEVVAVNVTQGLSDRTRMDIDISLVPVDSSTPVNLVFPFFLNGV
jgi:phage baseplate assembly protein W